MSSSTSPSPPDLIHPNTAAPAGPGERNDADRQSTSLAGRWRVGRYRWTCGLGRARARRVLVGRSWRKWSRGATHSLVPLLTPSSMFWYPPWEGYSSSIMSSSMSGDEKVCGKGAVRD